MKSWNFDFKGDCPAWIACLIAAIAIALVILFYRSKRAQMSRRTFVILTVLRTLVIVATALFLMKPVLYLSGNRAERNEVVILQDASQSMSIHDAIEGKSRMEAGLSLLRDPQYRILKAIAATHQVRFFTFGSVTAEAKPADALQPDQRTTALGEALKESVARVGQQSAGAVILMSDGVCTAGDDPGKVAETLGVPIFPVALGGKMAEKGKFFDVGIAAAPHNLELPVNNLAKLKFKLSNAGLGEFTEADRLLTMTLKQKDEIVASMPVQFPARDGSREVEMEYTPRAVGVQKLTVALPALPDEPVTQNNTREFMVRVVDPKIKVLIVEGVIRSEYRFLRKALGSDPNIVLTSVIKKSKEEFYHQDSDPGIDLSRGLPRKKEDWKKFDVVVLGDIARAEFADEQLQYLKEFVSGGGGLVTIGGYHAYGPGGYAQSPVADVLPLTMRGASDGQVEGNFAPELTPLGQGHPVFEGCDKFFQSGAQRALLDGANRVAGVKPGATVLAVHPAERIAGGEKLPIVAVQQYSAGRVLALTADTTWKWKFQMEGHGLDSPYFRFWRQSVRWAAGRKDEAPPSKDRLAAWADKLEYKSGEPVVIEARVQNEDGDPQSDATVRVEVRYPSAAATEEKAPGKDKDGAVLLDPDPASSGRYHGALSPSGGICRAIVSASDKDKEFSRVEFEFSVGQVAGEFDRVDVDEPLLRKLAEETGGEFHTMATASQIPEEIEKRLRLVAFHDEKNLWNTPGFVLVFLACASAEWVLRKRNALN